MLCGFLKMSKSTRMTNRARSQDVRTREIDADLKHQRATLTGESLRNLWMGVVLGVAILLGISSCKETYLRSIGADRVETVEKEFYVDFETAWASVLDALKSYRLDVSNRDSGSIVTRWKDNTAERNLLDGDGTIRPHLKAQFRFIVSVARSKQRGKEMVSVRVRKEQTVIADPLDEPRRIESDLIQERTLLYRIARITEQRNKLQELDKARVERDLKKAAAEAAKSQDLQAEPQVETLPSAVQE